MTYVKLLGAITIILIISSYASLAAGNPVGFPTPTPTPIPTPRPEPTAKPTLDMYCRSTAAASNLKVEVTGTLTYNKTVIPNAPIYLGYSADGGNEWKNFTLVQTKTNGGFGATWIPNATGNYLLNAHWEGNVTLHWIDATANLALTPDSAGNVFSVVSNSTISNLTYDSAIQELSFNTNGTSPTTGYVYACIPKAIVSDIQTLQINIDGKPIAFGRESRDDIWVVSCIYSQSIHSFTIQLPFTQALNSDTMPWNVIIIVAVIVVLIVMAVVAVIRRRRRTAAIVASILKQTRQ